MGLHWGYWWPGNLASGHEIVQFSTTIDIQSVNLTHTIALWTHYQKQSKYTETLLPAYTV